MKKALTELASLIHRLKTTSSLFEKEEILRSTAQVSHFLKQHPHLSSFLNSLSIDCLIALLSLIAVGQEAVILSMPYDHPLFFEKLRILISQLLSVEKLYQSIGGVIGYHYHFLKLAQEERLFTKKEETITYAYPPSYDLTTRESQQWIGSGIKGLDQLAEMYPIGGAGDRLGLICKTTHKALPAALLRYKQASLLELLVRDVQGREALYKKVYGKNITIPLCLMTSQEKDNHAHIQHLLEEKRYFGRSRESFLLFSQPQVPVMSVLGEWLLRNPLEIQTKPGGHGVIWKCALDAGIFDQLTALGKRYLLLRQINNPVSDTDDGILKFIGLGIHNQHDFGFYACNRILHSAAGMNVLKQKKTSQGSFHTISNLEYTDFIKSGVHDIPDKAGSPYSKFPANSNILFADLQKLLPLIQEKHLIPGLLINLKHHITTNEGNQVKIGRLESTMQNIADELYEPVGQKPKKTFSASYTRRKTLSPIKKPKDPSFQETPLAAFYDGVRNDWELLSSYCRFELPPIPSKHLFSKDTLPFITYWHPRLGPTYAIIGQKIQHGKMSKKSELSLFIEDVNIRHLDLCGSLKIMTSLQKEPQSGYALLHNVKVHNKGITIEDEEELCQGSYKKQESLTIILEGVSGFEAKDSIFSSETIIVPEGHLLSINNNQRQLKKLSDVYFWKHTLQNNKIDLTWEHTKMK